MVLVELEVGVFVSTENNNYCTYKGSSIIVSIFARVQSTLGGGGKSNGTLSKMLVLATVLVHETSLVNQHLYSMPLGGGREYVKRVLSVHL